MNGFSDPLFLCRYLPCFLLLYYLAAPELRAFVLLIGSIGFYAIEDLRFLPVLLGVTVLNLLLRKRCYKKSIWTLTFLVSFDIALLVLFKALGQIYGNEMLPLGISFYLFKMISYQVDLYRGKIKVKPGIIQSAAYFVMFPQIMSGPIMRYKEQKEELKSAPHPSILWEPVDRESSFWGRCKRIGEYWGDGIRFLLVGLAMKLLIADPLASFWNEIYAIGYESISTPLAWVGVVVCSMNLYFDFWGYSLMAAGCGVMLGFPFVENFSHPYAAVGVAEFYRRWHITLGEWFRDYVYIPLGGSRKGACNTLKNLFFVWLLTGAWHGFSLHFMLWAGILFLMIIWEKMVLKKIPFLMEIFGRLHVWVIIPLTWIIFTIGDLTLLKTYFSRLFPFVENGIAVNEADYLIRLETYWGFLLAGGILLIPQVFSLWKKYRQHVVLNICLLILFGFCLRALALNAANPFLYLKF